MTTKHDSAPIDPELYEQADNLLVYLKSLADDIAAIQAQAESEIAAITVKHSIPLEALHAEQVAAEKELITLMKKNKAVLFAGADVVNLQPGSLIRSKVDKVTIPKTALAECEAQHFDDVIKIVKSLDRDAIEKWPDTKLALIGAERKPKEEFSYSLKQKEA
jgi:hypothetical protein